MQSDLHMPGVLHPQIQPTANQNFGGESSDVEDWKYTLLYISFVHIQFDNKTLISIILILICISIQVEMLIGSWDKSEV